MFKENQNDIMIHVERSSVPIPEHFSSPRVNAEQEKIVRLLTGSREHLDQTRIRFDARIWKEARPALIKLFHGKCAYCESDVTSTSYADVEHFRPKTGVEEPDGTRSHYYYAWLAYEWENLLIACTYCNSPHKSEGKTMAGKGNRFPVQGSRARLLASVEECRATEESLLLDPCFDQPEEHLAFGINGFCAARTRRGEFTIQLLDLNRHQLVKARQETWTSLGYYVRNLLSSAIEKRQGGVDESAKLLADMLSRHRPYTAVARAAFRQYADELKKHGISFGIDPVGSLLRTELQRAQKTSRTAEDNVGVEGVGAVEAMVEPRRRYKGRAELPPHALDTIRRIEVRNFKAIEDIDFELPDPPPGEAEGERTPALMLLGENATGKSSVLEAVALALLGTEQLAKLGVHARTFVRRADGQVSPDETAEPAEVVIHFDGDGPPVRLIIDPRTDRFEGDPQPATVLVGYGPRRFFSERRRVHRSDEQSARVRTLFDPLAIIGNPTSWLMNCEQASFNAAIRALRELLLLPEEALLTRPPRGKRRGAEIMFEVQGEPEPLRRLSEGYKTTIATGVDIMREMLQYWPDLETARGVVLIDELETHLHPRWKMRIVGRLRRAMPLVQFIATTHDPLCLRGLFDGEAQVLRRDADRRIERVLDLPNVRGLSVEQLLTSEFFGLHSTEDPEFEEDVARYVALAAKRERSADEESELEQYRRVVGDTVTLGATPERRLEQLAVSEYLMQRRQAPARALPGLKHAAVSKIIDLWNSVTDEDQEP